MKKNTIKQRKVLNEDMTNIRNMFIILVIVILVCLGLYFLTEKINKEELANNTDTKIDYDLATVGTMFNRIEDIYYVILYSKKEDGNELDKVLDSYRSSDDYIKTYYINLDEKINSQVLKDNLNNKPSNPSEVSITGPTLYKINNGIVVNCYSSIDEIKKVLEN